MNKLTLRIISLLIFVSCFLSGKSQDPMYSQFTLNPLYYNPAYTGISEGLRLRTNYRKQWPNLPGDYKSYNFNMDIATRNIPGAGGIGLMFDKHIAGAGYYERVKFGIPVSVRVPLYENLIVQMGGMVSFVQKTLDWNKLIFVDQLDPRFGIYTPTSFEQPGNSKITYPDVDFGLLFRWVGFGYGGKEYIATFGVAMHHLFTPNESFYNNIESPLARKMVITGDVILQNRNYKRGFNNESNNKKDVKLNPGFIYESQQQFKTFSIGINVYKSNLYAGIWYRNENFDFTLSNAMVIMAGISAPINNDNRIKIMYSYDMLLTKSYARDAGGTHEISIIFELDSFIPFTKGNTYQSQRSRMSGLECSPF